MDILEYLFKNTDSIAVIISYFIPGALSIYVFRFVCKNTYRGKDDENLIFKSVIISGIAFICTDSFWNWLSIKNSILRVSIMTLICCLAAYGLGLLRTSGCLDGFLAKIRIKQTTNTFWSDAFEHGNKTKVEFVKDSKKYRGSLEYWDEFDDNECYFTIVNVKVSYVQDGITKKFAFPKNVRMIVYCKEVSDITIENDKIEKKLKK